MRLGAERFLCELTSAAYDSTERRRSLHEWESSSADNPFDLRVRGALLVKGEVDHKLQKNICIAAARALYDALERDSLKSKENQVAQVTAEIKQLMVQGYCRDGCRTM